MFIVALLLFSPNSFADQLDRCSPWPATGMVYTVSPDTTYDPPIPDSCYSVIFDGVEQSPDVLSMNQTNDGLVVDALKVQARQDALTAAATQAAKDKSDFAALKVKLRNKTATAADVRDALVFLLKKMGE